MGHQTWIVFTDPILAQEVFMAHGAVTSDRPPHTFFNYFSHGGIGVVFSNANKNWKKSRTAVLSVLAPNRVKQFTNLLAYEADTMVEQLVERSLLNGQLDPLKTINAGALNVILTVVFGKRVYSTDDPFLKELMAYIEPTLKYAGIEGSLSQYDPAFSLLDSLFGKKRIFENFILNVRDPLFRRLIREAMASDKDCLAKDFVGQDFSELDLIVMLSDLVAAGTDTISVTLSWIVVILSHHPQVQEKIGAEIDAFVYANGRLPTFEERDQVPYLICVQKECMRYRHTTAFGLPHITKEDVVVRDYLFPKGTVLLANMKGMHMNPEFYPDPETFKPERYLDNTRTMSASANGNVNNRDHFNFGFGRRICPGIHLAEVEMYYILVRIFGRCVIAPPLDSNGIEIPIDLDAARNSGVVISPAPFEMRFLPRNNSPLKATRKISSFLPLA
ncbi:cytochrome P450 [Chlamydoabsidia padenii]|nr:cytochrome P450 [Chlamydoabsidia padenii]